MERVNQIIAHPKYREYRDRIDAHERERRFCRHDLAHFLDVARIAEIMNLKERLRIGEEQIYAAALLHDIGRFVEYEGGASHEIASALLAPEILSDCGFSEAEQEEILAAIAGHRNRKIAEEASLRGVLYRADKKSRSCFGCREEASCNWSREKKNMELHY